MRAIVVGGAMAAAIAGTSLLSPPAAAQGAWCSEDMNSRNCGWYTLEQCRAAASGLGGGCYANPFVTRAPVVEPRKRTKRARSHS